MRYLSVCSGIEAATVAWHPLGWTPAAFSEIEPFPRAVLAHHYPHVPLHGDFTTIRGDEYGPVDLLVGGTPCQDFSVAGLRAGLAGDRGNLTLEFLRLAGRARPRWLVWENVPGVLSINSGRAFGAVLGGLAELGYGFAYRVLDAQFFGLAQRRERVFLVGHLGDWRRAAAVLFERESLQWNPPPRRKAGQGVARPVAAGSTGGSGYRNDADTADSLVAYAPGISPALKARDFKGPSSDGDGDGAPLIAHAFDARQSDVIQYGDRTGPLDTDGHSIAVAFQTRGGDLTIGDISGTLGTNADRASGGAPMVTTSAVAFSAKDHGADAGDIAPTLCSGGHNRSHANGGVMPAVAFDTTQITSKANRSNPKPGDPCHPLAAGAHPPAIAGSAVRRLTPRECERLQGFSDDYTLIPYRGKPAADGPRYRALGNSMAVPVMRWIGERIALVERLARKDAA